MFETLTKCRPVTVYSAVMFETLISLYLHLINRHLYIRKMNVFTLVLLISHLSVGANYHNLTTNGWVQCIFY